MPTSRDTATGVSGAGVRRFDGFVAAAFRRFKAGRGLACSPLEDSALDFIRYVHTLYAMSIVVEHTTFVLGSRKRIALAA